MNINLEAQNFPNFKLSTQEDLILFLIRNELLSTRFVNQLNTIGFDTSFFNVELSIVILSLLGFKARTDALLEWYYTTLDIYASKINLDNHDEINAITFDFYIKLKVKQEAEEQKNSCN
ncbi:hypothetical protein [Aquimarina algicola]|uniref:Uncharacterized protein n=1 Tax=Aquimarina algicola TaxID=2589995 RepID=A0A504JGW8_9FLAO|nr:hypothetical protein [Aquimarina algicola]TPN87932.1 hypothetical protein FHK87_10185 [Aquimarina algicola]